MQTSLLEGHVAEKKDELDIDISIEDDLGLDDLSAMDDVMDDLDKSLVAIDLSGLEEELKNESSKIASDEDDMMSSIQEEKDEVPESPQLSLVSNESDNSIDDAIDDFDPLDISETTSDDEHLQLPNFKNTDDITSAIEIFETYSIENLQIALEKISDGDFEDKSDYLRAKRKISSVLKRKEKEIADAEQAEMDRITAENEAANNIVAIDQLIHTATDIRPAELSEEFDLTPKETKKAPNKIIEKIKESPLVTAAQKKYEEKVSLENQAKINEAKELVAVQMRKTQAIMMDHFNYVLKTRVFATGFLIFFEILKTSLPAVIVGLFVLNLNQKSVAPDVLESLVSDDVNRMQIGLELLRSNYQSKDKNYYYQLSSRRIERELDHAWDPTNKDSLVQRTGFLIGLKDLKFKDEGFDIEKIIHDKNQKNKKQIRLSYETFYNTEQEKFRENSKFIGALLEANIFLNNNKCVKALEKYVEAFSILKSSKSVLYGKTIAINCIAEDTETATIGQRIFDIQEKLDTYELIETINSERKPASL